MHQQLQPQKYLFEKFIWTFSNPIQAIYDWYWCNKVFKLDPKEDKFVFVNEKYIKL